MCESSGRRSQAEGGELFDAAAVPDQARIVQRQAAAGLVFDDGLQAQHVDLAIGTDGFVQRLGRHAVVLIGEIDGAGGEVDAEGDQPGDDIEQQPDRIQRGDGGVDLAVDLPPAVGVEQRAAGGQLGEQGDGQHAADDTGTSTHRDLHGKWRNYTSTALIFR